MPIRQIRIQQLILSDLQDLLESRPAGPDGLGMVVRPSLIDETLRDLLFLVFGLLHLDDELVVRVEFGGDFLCQGGTATGEFGALIVVAGETGLAGG